MRRIFNKIFITFTLFFFIFSIPLDNLNASQEFKIVLKINDSIITNKDIINEYNYLKFLNKDLDKISKAEIMNIAKESLIRENIKKDEIEKYIKVENFDRDELMEGVIKNVYKRLNFQTVSDFQKYLATFDFSLADVEKKLKIEIMWNQLIAEKFNSQIMVDEDKIRKKVLDEKINYKNLIEYDLSEIVFSAKNKEELVLKKEQIKKTIENISFETAANKFSISDTANFGGNIGKVNENQLSQLVKDELKKINSGEYTNTINVGNNFMIIKINEKKLVDLKLDENEIIKKMVEIERKRQYENFSLIYYNKIKLNSQINEL
tara:strand:+ start:13372 stop:14331 length:960 start_codon:yes stop_codon:yes gene_type:complete